MYSIPCSCGNVYICETTRRFDTCKRGDEKVSAIAEHAWQQHHPIKWEEVRVVDRASKNRELKIKEAALHIQMTPDNYSMHAWCGYKILSDSLLCYLFLFRFSSPPPCPVFFISYRSPY